MPSIPGEAKKLVLVCPQHGLVLPHVLLGHDVVEVDNDILGVVSDDHEEASLLLLDAILNQGGDPLVSTKKEQ